MALKYDDRGEPSAEYTRNQDKYEAELEALYTKLHGSETAQ